MIDEEFFRFAGCPVKKKTYICSMIPPRIEQSTKEERRAFVMEAWKCLHDCESIWMLRWTSETIITEDKIRFFREFSLQVNTQIR